MADFMRDRAGEDQLGSDGVSGSDDGIVSEGGVPRRAEVPFVYAEISIVMPLAHAEERWPARFTVTTRSLRASP